MKDARDAAGRMDALERFLEYWYGPRREEYGETEERLAALPLPYPLRRFYAFAGQRPPLREGGNDYFYQGGSGHHLLDLDAVERDDDGRLNFFMEYQGDWNGLTLADAEDPPVWLKGVFEDDNIGAEEGDEGERIVRASDSLSRFLVTHCLMATLYEYENFRGTAQAKDGSLLDWFRGSGAMLLWDAVGLTWPPGCLDYVGAFHLLPDRGILVHERGAEYQFVARDATGARLLEEAGR